MQDVLEDYIGHKKSKGGRRSDDPTAQQFGCNDLTIAAQRDIAPVIRGNVGERYQKKKWYQVSEEPVHKRIESQNHHDMTFSIALIQCNVMYANKRP